MVHIKKKELLIHQQHKWISYTLCRAKEAILKRFQTVWLTYIMFWKMQNYRGNKTDKYFPGTNRGKWVALWETQGDFLGVFEVLYVSLLMMVILLYAFVRIQKCTLKRVNFTICKIIHINYNSERLNFKNQNKITS